MKKIKSHGFRVSLDGVDHYVTFKYESPESIRCTLYVQSDIPRLYGINDEFVEQESWTSKVTCKSPDVYDQVAGEQLALSKVIEKFRVNRERRLSRYLASFNRNLDELTTIATRKHNKIARSK